LGIETNRQNSDLEAEHHQRGDPPRIDPTFLNRRSGAASTHASEVEQMDERAWESSAVSSLHRAVAWQSHTNIAYLSAPFFFARSRGGRRSLKPLFHSFLFIGTAGGPVCAGRKTQVLSFMLCCTAMSSIERHSEHERHWQDDSHRHREPIFQSPL